MHVARTAARQCSLPGRTPTNSLAEPHPVVPRRKRPDDRAAASASLRFSQAAKTPLEFPQIGRVVTVGDGIAFLADQWRDQMEFSFATWKWMRFRCRSVELRRSRAMSLSRWPVRHHIKMIPCHSPSATRSRASSVALGRGRRSEVGNLGRVFFIAGRAAFGASVSGRFESYPQEAPLLDRRQFVPE